MPEQALYARQTKRAPRIWVEVMSEGEEIVLLLAVGDRQASYPLVELLDYAQRTGGIERYVLDACDLLAMPQGKRYAVEALLTEALSQGYFQRVLRSEASTNEVGYLDASYQPLKLGDAVWLGNQPGTIIWWKGGPAIECAGMPAGTIPEPLNGQFIGLLRKVPLK